MRFLALAADYDGTLAHHGRVDEATLAALQRVRASGRRLLLVTGRELPSLLRTFAHTALFDLVVAENGGLLYEPAARRERALGESPPVSLVSELRAAGVDPLSVGRVVVATVEPHQVAALETIHRLGLGHKVVFNKGAVMLLPAGVDKASGLAVALGELGIGPERTVGIGDAENDHALFRLCGVGAAVANALPALKERAHYVTRGERGAGVAELADLLVADDLRGLPREPYPSPAAPPMHGEVDVVPDA
ncbi:MAG: haloacid dehalogenase [Acidobacteria bacterium]|nr:MAG: haloacid dehalogenase [Acidobacteriota bacterium]